MSLDVARRLLACPVCGEALEASGAGLSCGSAHAFDVARQGYVNLLGAKAPANADTPEDAAARGRLLGSGLYDRIAAEVAGRLALSSTIVEVGAGTGFYLARALGERDARGVALDVSVAAAKVAAKSHPRVASVVADVWRPLPLRAGRFDGVLCVFAPRNMGEFARVLRDGGLLVVVTPTASHLDTLRERYGLLGIEDDKDARLARSAVGWFQPIARKTLDYVAPARASVVRDLIAMGPNAFHGVPDDVTDAEVHVSVTVSLFRKAAGTQAWRSGDE